MCRRRVRPIVPLLLAGCLTGIPLACLSGQEADPAVGRFDLGDEVLPAGTQVLAEPFPNRVFSPIEGETLVLAGQANLVLEQARGFLEAFLVRRFGGQRLRIRNMAWEGDTVFEQWRDLNFGDWGEQLEAAGATSVLAWFGQMEALEAGRRAEDAGLPPGTVDPGEVARFEDAYAQLLDRFAARTARLVLVAPLPFESAPEGARTPDPARFNPIVSAFSTAVRELASRRGAVFVDLDLPGASASGRRLTTNGIHLNEDGWLEAAAQLAGGLGAGSAPERPDERLLEEIRHKNRMWFNCWRTMNWAFAYGDRTTQLFGSAAGPHPPLTEELKQFIPLVAGDDRRIHAVALGEPVGPRTIALSGESEPGPPAIPPEEERASFRVADGFDVNLFASEADGIINPVRMNWDASGRLWVCCIPTYPHIDPGTEPGDYLMVCEDADGDGRADRFTRFAEGLFLPMGVEFSATGVYVCENTQLVHLEDRDGDGRADSREVVLSGFGTADTHQLINSIRWGGDGALWFSQGHHIYSRVETPWGISRLDKAGIWRFDPRRLHLQGFFNLSTAGANDWGVVFDDWGQVFHGTGDRNVAYYSVPGLVPTLFPRDYNGVGAMFQSQAKNNGLDFMGSSALPADWRGHAVSGVFMGNSVDVHRVIDDASGFRSEVVETLIASDRTEFRPVDVLMGPDGGIYVCDWFNKVIGHYQASYRHPERDRSHGRIWRLTWKDGQPVRRPDLASLDADGLAERLRSGERWERDLARRRLFALPSDEVLPVARRLAAASDFSFPGGAALAIDLLGVLGAHDEPDELILDRLLDHGDPRVRAVATRFVGLWGNRFSDSLALLRRAVADEHPRVRLEAVVACGWIAPLRAGEAMETAVRALDRPTDRFIEFALGQTAQALAPAWTDALAGGRIDFGGRTDHLAFALAGLGGQEVAEHVRGLVERLMSEQGSVPAGILVLLADTGGTEDLARVFRLGIGEADVLRAVARSVRLRGLTPEDSMAGDLEGLLQGSAPDAVKAAALELAGAACFRQLGPVVRRLAFSDGGSPAVRASALRTIPALTVESERPSLARELDGRLDALGGWAGDPVDLQVGQAMLAALWEIGPQSAASRSVAILIRSGGSADAAARVADVVLDAPGGTARLAEALAESRLESGAAAALQTVLRERGISDSSLTQVLDAAVGTSVPVGEYDEAWVADLAREVTEAGDPSRGGAVYARAGGACVACHRIDGSGGVIGPDLSLLGRGMPVELIIEAVVWPKRQIKEGYFLTEIETHDGRRVAGYRIRETESEIALRPLAGDDTVSIARSAVKSRSDAGSAMPDGIVSGMSREDLRDLVAYLASLGRAEAR